MSDTNVLVNDAREALRAVMDPEIGMNVIELGMVRDIAIEDDKAHVVMILTTPFCPYAPMLMEQVRSTVQDSVERPTTIELGTEMWRPEFMEDGGEAFREWGIY
jgi:metal-sulfur cluster biosynthetic enzyme